MEPYSLIASYIAIRGNEKLTRNLQLINHGVPEQVICDLRKDISNFFKLPLEAKKVYSQLPNSLEGYGQVFVMSEEQKLDWADMFYLVLRPNESRDMRFWPACPPSFRSVTIQQPHYIRKRCFI